MKVAADHVKRAYEPPGRADGTRVLVDRPWPRGVSKGKAAVRVVLGGVEATPWRLPDVERMLEGAALES